MDEVVETLRQRRSLSLCKYLTEDGEMIGDYNLMMAPLYQWCERMRRRTQHPEPESDTSMWGQLGSCASSQQRHRNPSYDYTIGIPNPLLCFYR
ncbi:unnamed protein product [Anisakis simplex]|uniref:Uncharacterized protein n=1 Tax=Anisakis simplex TaxID=6269 RepID=A0A3P6PX08_ANISI|nr:unnamed protein product [Anisakis simplex]